MQLQGHCTRTGLAPTWSPMSDALIHPFFSIQLDLGQNQLIGSDLGQFRRKREPKWMVRSDSGWIKLIRPDSGQYGCQNKPKWAVDHHSYASCGLVREREEKKRWEDTKKLLELRRGEEEEYKLITKEYKLRRWESYLFHVGVLGNWKMSKETFLEGGFLFTITKNIDFIKSKS